MIFEDGWGRGFQTAFHLFAKFTRTISTIFKSNSFLLLSLLYFLSSSIVLFTEL